MKNDRYVSVANWNRCTGGCSTSKACRTCQSFLVTGWCTSKICALGFRESIDFFFVGIVRRVAKYGVNCAEHRVLDIRNWVVLASWISFEIVIESNLVFEGEWLPSFYFLRCHIFKELFEWFIHLLISGMCNSIRWRYEKFRFLEKLRFSWKSKLW